MTEAPDSTTDSKRTLAVHGGRFLPDLDEAVGKAVVGAQLPLRMLATAVLADGHALLEDVPGVGKTLLARAFSQALGLTFARVQGTPALVPPDVTGRRSLDHGRLRL